MKTNNHNESIIGTFLSGTLGIISIFFLALIIIPIAPVLVVIASVIYLVWFFVSLFSNKQNTSSNT